METALVMFRGLVPHVYATSGWLERIRNVGNKWLNVAYGGSFEPGRVRQPPWAGSVARPAKSRA